jgi:hypothetical protein
MMLVKIERFSFFSIFGAILVTSVFFFQPHFRIMLAKIGRFFRFSGRFWHNPGFFSAPLSNYAGENRQVFSIFEAILETASQKRPKTPFFQPNRVVW